MRSCVRGRGVRLVTGRESNKRYRTRKLGYIEKKRGKEILLCVWFGVYTVCIVGYIYTYSGVGDGYRVYI